MLKDKEYYRKHLIKRSEMSEEFVDVFLRKLEMKFRHLRIHDIEELKKLYFLQSKYNGRTDELANYFVPSPYHGMFELLMRL